MAFGSSTLATIFTRPPQCSRLHFSVMTLRPASRPVAMRKVIELIRSASIPSSPPALCDVVQVVEVQSRRG